MTFSQSTVIDSYMCYMHLFVQICLHTDSHFACTFTLHMFILSAWLYAVPYSSCILLDHWECIRLDLQCDFFFLLAYCLHTCNTTGRCCVPQFLWLFCLGTVTAGSPAEVVESHSWPLLPPAYSTGGLVYEHHTTNLYLYGESDPI